MFDSHLAQAIIEGTSDAVFVKDTEGRYLLVNQSAANFIGRPKDAILGRTDRDWFLGDSVLDLLDGDQQIMRAGSWVTREETLTSNGTRTYSATKGPLRAPDGQIVGIIGISRDITQQRIDAERLKQSNEALERFAHVVSHDLREPLRAMVINIGRSKNSLSNESRQRVAPFLKLAEESGRRMNSLIEGVLSDAMLYQHSNALGPCDTREVVARTLSDLSATLEEQLAIVQCDGLPRVLGDEVQLSQLFQNLLTNAIRYRSELPPHIRISAELHNDHWCFAVEDNGLGIPPEARTRIFLPYERFGRPGGPLGTGIGLLTCKRIIERHRGEIWVEGRPGGGSIFRFTLPAA